MPYHLKTLRADPARSIVWVIALASMLLQLLTLLPWISPEFWPMVPNVLIILSVCLWALWTTTRNSLNRMPTATFWLFFMWVWSGLTRLVFSPDPAMLLWGPFLVVACALGVCYVYLNGQKRVVGGSRGT